MSARSLLLPACAVLVLTSLLLTSSVAVAQEIRLPLPKRSKPTPVQKYNRDGVKALEKHDIEDAKRHFYKAYLLDPNDPFTLNNLGYVAELEGEIERAQRYYELAAEHRSEATVDRASSEEYEGMTVSAIAGRAEAGSMMVNRLNVEAIGLLQRDRAPEADLLLQRALKMDARNPFTLNNLGYAREQQGELEAAMGYYQQAAALNSNEPVIVTLNDDWRGEPISKVAGRNARNIRREMTRAQTVGAQVARLNLRGVSAINRNDRRTARVLFEQAYKLNPSDAFTLNNMGYIAELDGDRETANFYYRRAQEANRAGATVTVATRKDAEGRQLRQVADMNDVYVEARMRAETEARRRQGGEPTLKRRDGSQVPPAEQRQNEQPPENE